MNKIKKMIIKFLKLYLIYFLISFIIIFAFPNKDENIELNNNYYSDSKSADRAFVVEEMELSAQIKINLIDNAKKSIDLAYFKIQNDEAGNLIFAKLLEAADRGVKIRIVLDGKINKLGKDLNGLNNLIFVHPNIEIRYYEPLNLLKPYTLNNMLHDKYIVVDSEIALLGGRNIGNQYFSLEEINETTTYDREVCVINTDNSLFSAVNQIEDYFTLTWNSKYTKAINKKITEKDIEKSSKKREELNNILFEIERKYTNLFNTDIDYISLSHSTNKITLIYNSIDRFKKNPTCLNEIALLMNSAKNNILLQSPYVIITNEMKKYLDIDRLGDKEINIITNSEYSTPNFFAFAGYLKYRNKLLDSNANIYEYNSVGSIHAKSYIIDDRLAIIGSFNMDSKSSFLSTETMLVIDSIDISSQLKSKIDIIERGSVLVSDKNNENNVRDISKVKFIFLRIMKYIEYPFSYLL